MPDIDSFSGTGSDELESTVPDIFVVSPEASQADTGSNIGQESTAGTFNKSYGGTDSTMSLQVPDSRATRNRGRRRRLSAGTGTTTATLSLKFGPKVLNVDVEVPNEFTKEQTDKYLRRCATAFIETLVSQTSQESRSHSEERRPRRKLRGNYTRREMKILSEARSKGMSRLPKLTEDSSIEDQEERSESATDNDLTRSSDLDDSGADTSRSMWGRERSRTQRRMTALKARVEDSRHENYGDGASLASREMSSAKNGRSSTDVLSDRKKRINRHVKLLRYAHSRGFTEDMVSTYLTLVYSRAISAETEMSYDVLSKISSSRQSFDPKKATLLDHLRDIAGSITGSELDGTTRTSFDSQLTKAPCIEIGMAWIMLLDLGQHFALIIEKR